jgi:hypothetical protein
MSLCIDHLVRQKLRAQLRYVGGRGLQCFQQFFQFLARGVVMLGGGEIEGVFEGGLRFRGTAEGDEALAELDVDDHPVGFFVAESAEVLDGVGEVAGIDVGLRQVEAAEIVVGEFPPESKGLGDSVGCHL